ncbi:MAG: hypothetical protein QOE50_229 [Sphingomonadales bacterium]|jgi:uncharacterized membrane protein YccC|nr:hypothetical protein [Sphingomonadales bacterium]
MQFAGTISRHWPPSLEATDRLLFAFRCTLASCIAYAIADHLWPQLPLWAPVSALSVSQHRWRQTEQFVSGLSLGTLVGAVIAALVSLVGSLVGMPMIAQVGIAVAIAAAFSMNWTSARAAMWMALIAVWLIHRFPGAMATSAGWLMAEQVVLGAIIGGLLGALFEFAGPSRPATLATARARDANIEGES